MCPQAAGSYSLVLGAGGGGGVRGDLQAVGGLRQQGYKRTAGLRAVWYLGTHRVTGHISVF